MELIMCKCGIGIYKNWNYCPICGTAKPVENAEPAAPTKVERPKLSKAEKEAKRAKREARKAAKEQAPGTLPM